MMRLVFLWIAKQGGVEEMQQRSQAKLAALANVMKASKGFYSCPVDSRVRSRINVPFRISGENGVELEEKFLTQAAAKGMLQLRGHRYIIIHHFVH